MIDSNAISEMGIAAPTTSTARGNDELGQEEFLQLLTTQMQNQDPFSPMENGEFMGQIAQFSSVTGIQEMQKSMETLATNLTSNESLQAAALVDRTVLAEGDTGYLPEGGEMVAAVDLESSVPGLAVGIYDQVGQLVRHVELGTQSSGRVQFAWDGTTDSGAVARPGLYTVRAESHGAGRQPTAEQTLIAGRVSSVSLGQGGAVLNLDNIGAVNFANVREIG